MLRSLATVVDPPVCRPGVGVNLAGCLISKQRRSLLLLPDNYAHFTLAYHNAIVSRHEVGPLCNIITLIIQPGPH